MNNTDDTAVQEPPPMTDDFPGDDELIETGPEEDERDVSDPPADETGLAYRPPEVSSIQLGEHFRITPRGLVTIDQPSFEDRAQMGATLHVLAEAIQLALGDFANETEAALGEEASQILDADMGWAESTRKTYAWVAKNVLPENRLIPPLTFGHLQVVANLVHTQQRKWLDKASLGDGTTPWSIGKLKTELTAAKAGGSQNLRFFIVVDAGSEKKQMALAARLESEGYIVVKRAGVKLERNKVAKARRKDAGKSRVAKAAAELGFPKTHGAKKRGRGRPRQ
jgi:hypothetical protein